MGRLPLRPGCLRRRGGHRRAEEGYAVDGAVPRGCNDPFHRWIPHVSVEFFRRGIAPPPTYRAGSYCWSTPPRSIPPRTAMPGRAACGGASRGAQGRRSSSIFVDEHVVDPRISEIPPTPGSRLPFIRIGASSPRFVRPGWDSWNQTVKSPFQQELDCVFMHDAAGSAVRLPITGARLRWGATLGRGFQGKSR